MKDIALLDSGSDPETSGSVASAEPGGETRARLLETAVKLFAERGFERAKLVDIARAAGFTTGAIYANFPNKAQLLAEAIAAYAPDEIVALFEPLVGLPLTREVVRELLEILLTGPSVPEAETLILEGLALAARDPTAADVLVRGVRERMTADQEPFNTSDARSVVYPDLTEEALRYLVLVLIFGAMAMKALGYDPPPPPDVDALLDHLVSAFVPDGGPGDAE